MSSGSASARLSFGLGLLGIAGGVGVLSMIVVACTTDYQKGVDDPEFGAPGALENRKPPGRTSELGSSSGGGVGSGDGGSAPSGQPLCVTNGGALVDAGPCSVSFRSDVLATFGTANCGNADCHGGASPRNEPRVDPGEPALMYEIFTNYKMKDSTLYVNPCSTSTEKDDQGKWSSGIHCNLNSLGTCGSKMPQGGTFPPDALSTVETWVKCGAPNN